MDVNVVVVYVNTGRPTQAHHRAGSNLRLNSFSRPDARPQELCGAPREKRVFAAPDKGFPHCGIFPKATRRGGRLLIFCRRAQIESAEARCEEAFQDGKLGGYLNPERKCRDGDSFHAKN